MLRIDDDLLKSIGLGDLPEVERRSLLDHLRETLELRVGMKLASKLSEEELENFEKLLPTETDSPEQQKSKEAAALTWLETNFPNYKDVVKLELDTLVEEVKKDAPKIISASSNSTT